ncbi:AGE family epimerase/isomerase [Oceanobacillus kapialis]|uniref:AGE family epimerase/isomerase n=1 Tax=Oceanobacillus kapialis TaxID=481353 RepID=UPI00384E0CE2
MGQQHGPETYAENWLHEQIDSTLAFYYPTCIDEENGGYNHSFYDDGELSPYSTKHLVGTCRFIYNFSIGAILGKGGFCLEAAEHGLRFLQEHHQDKVNGGYYWTLDGQLVTEDTKYAYGHAFVLLAASKAYTAGIEWAGDVIDSVYKVLEEHFWEDAYHLYADELSADWSEVAEYRGQNANMHMTEAMIAAYEATSYQKYLDRAYQLADAVTGRLTFQTKGLVWEHFTPEWEPDWTFVETDESKQEFRPHGFVPGHSIEWSKLLIMLDRHISEPWMTDRAVHLYQEAYQKGADMVYGGIIYSISADKITMDTDKYYWVQAETFGASALLARKLNNPAYWQRYEAMLDYCSNIFIDHAHGGGWYNMLFRDNIRQSPIKSEKAKADYHPIANYYETLRVLGAD